MPRVSELRTNCTAGELSKTVNARTNFSRYFNGSEILENWVVLTQGPVFRRKGFRFIAETKNSANKSRLISFEFSTLQAYAIEVGGGYLRFFSQQGRVLENTVAITATTQANPVVITANSHGYSNGDLVVIRNVGGMIEINDKEFTVANVTTNTFELQGIDGTGFGAYTTGGNVARVHEISNPYSESELFDLKFVQDSDIMYIAHPNHPVQKLIRVAANEFTLGNVDFIKGPYIEQNIVSTDLITISGGSPWTKGSTLTLTASGGHTPFTNNHVGGLWKVTEGTDVAHLKITGFTSSTVVTVEAQEDVPASLQNVAKFTWSEGEFSNARSFSGAISFHEQRLVLAGSINEPQKVWFSKSNADYENFEAGTEADEAFNVKIAAQKGDPIRWLFSDNVLFIGTANGIFRVTNSRNGSALAVDDIDVKRNISYGCSPVQPELVGELPVYIQRGDAKLRGVNFNIQSDKYGARDLTVDADHIITGGVSEVDYQQDPLSSLWAIKNNGEIARLTLEQDQEVLAWSRFTTKGAFESAAIISGQTDNDEIYCIINRTINGATKRFIEVQEPNYLVDNVNRFYVDSGLTYNGTGSAELTLSSGSGSFVLVTEEEEAILVTEDDFILVTEEEDVTITSNIPIFTSADVGKEIHQLSPFGTGRALIIEFTDSQTVVVEIIESFSENPLPPDTWAFAVTKITGLEHLIGETVSINSDGATVPHQIVDSTGVVNIDNAGSIIHVGLPYTSRQRSMPIEATALSNIIGSSQHKVKRIDTCIVRFADTNGGEISIDGGKETIPILARGTNDNMNETPPLFEGDREVTLGTDWSDLGQIDILQSGPQPMTIKSITYKVTVNDK